ncbi:hypothetical protein FA15DRAFT_414633 [Coprinopsis marcescibilis]|uniref:Uncharacterized protein n=1 Tax=Coprinopsis marcescibilis TaxID=230819 RepID=A0A5C3KAJ4_COPMA|nr:hypothetical protein FA15DRAFT_414633 [Coprinopsis marcescibilis]
MYQAYVLLIVEDCTQTLIDIDSHGCALEHRGMRLSVAACAVILSAAPGCQLCTFALHITNPDESFLGSRPISKSTIPHTSPVLKLESEVQDLALQLDECGYGRAQW